MTRFFFIENLEYEPIELLGKKMTAASTRTALEHSLERLEKLGDFTVESMEADLRVLAEELELKPGQLFGSLRVAFTGLSVSPPLFQTMVVLGRERCLTRLREAVSKSWKLPE
jgi:glutamyl-tRNA synthetase